MKRAVTPGEMETMARTLRSATETSALAPEELTALHNRFMAEDAAGGQWTIGIKSGQWHKRAGDKWVNAQPPAALKLDLDLLLALRALQAPAGQQAAATQAAAPVAAGFVCAGCGAAIQPDQQFCAACGARVQAGGGNPAAARPRVCPRCGRPVADKNRFCTKDGTPVP